MQSSKATRPGSDAATRRSALWRCMCMLHGDVPRLLGNAAQERQGKPSLIVRQVAPHVRMLHGDAPTILFEDRAAPSSKLSCSCFCLA